MDREAGDEFSATRDQLSATRDELSETRGGLSEAGNEPHEVQI